MPSELSHLATSLPSLMSDKCEYPPPGQITIAAPGVALWTRKGVIVGMSCGSFPTALGAPVGQRTIGGDWAAADMTSIEINIMNNAKICLIDLFVGASFQGIELIFTEETLH